MFIKYSGCVITILLFSFKRFTICAIYSISVLKKEYKGKGEIGWIFKRIELENFDE